MSIAPCIESTYHDAFQILGILTGGSSPKNVLMTVLNTPSLCVPGLDNHSIMLTLLYYAHYETVSKDDSMFISSLNIRPNNPIYRDLHYDIQSLSGIKSYMYEMVSVIQAGIKAQLESWCPTALISIINSYADGPHFYCEQYLLYRFQQLEQAQTDRSYLISSGALTSSYSPTNPFYSPTDTCYYPSYTPTDPSYTPTDPSYTHTNPSYTPTDPPYVPTYPSYFLVDEKNNQNPMEYRTNTKRHYYKFSEILTSCYQYTKTEERQPDLKRHCYTFAQKSSGSSYDNPIVLM